MREKKTEKKLFCAGNGPGEDEEATMKMHGLRSDVSYVLSVRVWRRDLALQGLSGKWAPHLLLSPANELGPKENRFLG